MFNVRLFKVWANSICRKVLILLNKLIFTHVKYAFLAAMKPSSLIDRKLRCDVVQLHPAWTVVLNGACNYTELDGAGATSCGICHTTLVSEHIILKLKLAFSFMSLITHLHVCKLGVIFYMKLICDR